MQTPFVRLCGLGLVLSLVYSGLARADEKKIVLGMSAAFTGPSRGLSIELYRGSMAYFKHVNDHGGIHGRRLIIQPYDDGYDPHRAIENTIQLVERDDVFLLFDYMGSPTVTRMLPLLKRYEERSIFLFFPFTGAEPMRRPPYGEYVFNLRTSYGRETSELVDRFVAVGRKRVAVFYQIDAFGRSGWDGARTQLARKHGLRMVAEATYRRGTPHTSSFLPQVEILRQAEPDVVLVVATYAASAGFIRDARDAGWNVPIANVSGVDADNLLRLLLETGKEKGRDYTANLINSQVVPYHDDAGRDDALPAVRQYRELMDKYHPTPPRELLDHEYQTPRYSFISFEGYLNARLLAVILDKLGPDPQRKDLRRVAESIDRNDLGIGVPVSLALDSKGKHQGIDQVYFTVVSDGRFVALDDWKKWRK
jgi:ABC-type branched-subunit amino acid transport system substrate-binding protein